MLADCEDEMAVYNAIRNGVKSGELFDLDRLDTSNVENTSYMFLNCLTLKAVSILGWEASGTTDVDQMLSGCSTYILATEEQREFLNKITGSTQHGILTRNLS